MVVNDYDKLFSIFKLTELDLSNNYLSDENFSSLENLSSLNVRLYNASLIEYAFLITF